VTTEEEEEEEAAEGLKVGGGSHPCDCGGGGFEIRAFDIPVRVISKRSQRLLCSGPKRRVLNESE
jgi:hypothetical protein